MNAVFSQTKYIVKQQGLSIASKYRLYGPEGKEPLLFIEQKTKLLPPSITTHVYADEKKTQEVLTFKNSPTNGIDRDVIDAETGQKIGGLCMAADKVSEIFKDAWRITDANDQPIGKVFEKSASRSLLRGLVGNELPQQLDVAVGETSVGAFRQKVKMMGYELIVDFSMDVAHLLDRRLGVAAAIFVALHHGNEE
jgi:hypothetical protein